MADEEAPPPALANPLHVEDIAAPIIYVDHCLGGGFSGSGDNITLTFATKILDHRHNPPVSLTKTVLRLVMPRNARADTAGFIGELLGKIEKGGEAPPANATIN